MIFAVDFATGAPRGFRDLLRTDDDAYQSVHRMITDRGFLMLPLAPKRNHISGAHPAGDIDRTLDTAGDVAERTGAGR
ncbi:hypothetical protein [Rhizomonospora bruguierae]|uniref:hypothetical protein n=1 Tax=Rhizomonospora bruguierae TaxID=1581705 RepID=UPI001BCF207E|nr:hypothetical protein [Micromonospora sp. NBRC 107566]